MNTEIFAFTLDIVGKAMIAYTAVMVHYRVWQEHSIDEKVFSTMKREQRIGIIGIAFMILGYLLHVFPLLS